MATPCHELAGKLYSCLAVGSCRLMLPVWQNRHADLCEFLEMPPIQVITDFAAEAIVAGELEHRLVPSTFDITPPSSRERTPDVGEEAMEPDPPTMARIKAQLKPILKPKVVANDDIVMSEAGGTSSQSVKLKKKAVRLPTVIAEVDKVIGSGKASGSSSKRSLGWATGRSDGPAKRPKVALKPDVFVPGSALGDPPMIDLGGLSFKEGDAVDMGQVPLVVAKVGIVFLSTSS